MRRADQQRWVPPSRRGQAAGDAATEQRGLEGASPAVPSQVRLVVLREGEYDTGSCPLDIEVQEEDAKVLTIFYPDRLPAELLRWFADTFGGGGGRLEFPPSLSKQERARWHQAADRLRLHTVSVGIGEGRYLTIATEAAGPADVGQPGGGGAPAAVAGGRLRLTAEQERRARQVYDCCQMEGGKHWERSRGEIEAMVAAGGPLPDDLQALVDKRLRGEEVFRLLKGGQPPEALSLLVEDNKLAWVKDSETGGYPVHLAAWKGYESVVLFLASLPGVLEQRDGRRDTALAVARRRRHTAIEELLLEAGAKPEHASYQDPASSSREAAAGAAGEGEEEYSSWTPAERRSYRHGGEGGSGRGGGGGGRGGAPPGLQPHGRGGGLGGSWGRGRGRSAAPAAAAAAAAAPGSGSQSVLEQHQEPPKPHCPW